MDEGQLAETEFGQEERAAEESILKNVLLRFGLLWLKVMHLQLTSSVHNVEIVANIKLLYYIVASLSKIFYLLYLYGRFYSILVDDNTALVIFAFVNSWLDYRRNCSGSA